MLWMQLLNGHTEITIGIKFFTYLLMNDFLKKTSVEIVIKEIVN